jgi:prolyl-tRNA synthetase
MAESNKFQDGVSLELASIPPNYTNKSKLRHCLAAADFVADPKDVAVLQTEKDTDKLQSAASRVVTDLCAQLNEWEVGQRSSRKKVRSTGTTILGLSKRVMTYRNRIKKAQKLPEAVKTETVKFITLEELKRLEAQSGNG